MRAIRSACPCSPVLAALFVLLLSSCGEGDGRHANLGSPGCRQQLEALQACGYEGEGGLWFCYGDASPLRQCWGECASRMTCEELHICDYPDCYRDCLTVPFDCGDGEQIYLTGVCNGTANCSNGSDEADCPSYTFECEDGSGSIPGEKVCDSSADCADGSDEVCVETLVPCGT